MVGKNDLKTPDRVRVLKPCVATVITASSIVTDDLCSFNCIVMVGCNSDNCKQYCDSTAQIYFLTSLVCCNSDNCKQYCDDNTPVGRLYYSSVATVITASSIVT